MDMQRLMRAGLIISNCLNFILLAGCGSEKISTSRGSTNSQEVPKTSGGTNSSEHANDNKKESKTSSFSERWIGTKTKVVGGITATILALADLCKDTEIIFRIHTKNKTQLQTECMRTSDISKRE